MIAHTNASGDKGEHVYLPRASGDRLHPSKLHPRYAGLRQYAEALGSIIGSAMLTPGEVVLDYGCGGKPYESLFVKKFARYIAADLPGNCEASLKITPEGGLPLNDEKVDCVFSGQVLEHVGDPRRYLSECHRVLKPAGSLILSTHGIWAYHPDPNDYWRWTVKGLELEIARAGFEIVEMRSVLNLAPTAIQLWQDATSAGLPRFLRLFYCCSLQSLIGLLSRLSRNELSPNAAVYIVLARKR